MMKSIVGKSNYTQTQNSKTYFPIRGWTLNEEEIMKQNDPKNQMFEKNGFYFNPQNNHWIFYYPEEFCVPSDHNKYVIFQYCRCSIDNHIHGEVEVHASFIPRDNYCDSLVYYANLQVPDDNRKYKVNTNRKMAFEVWFTNGRGEPFLDTPDTDTELGHHYDINFVLFLKLIY